MNVKLIRKSQLYFILSFLLLIGIGCFLLQLPLMNAENVNRSWVDALFTSTSAVCVTGLNTVYTSSYSIWGQAVILMLIQLGGLGIMTISASLLILIGKQLSVSNSMIMSNLNDSSLHGTENIIYTVIRYTLVAEAVGFLLLFPAFWLVEGHGLFEALYYSLFHTISGFCNAGFSPFDNSLCGVGTWIKLVIAGLMIAGGLGVYVISDILQKLYDYKRLLRVYTKIILWGSFCLLLTGTLLFWLLNPGEMSLVDAFFQSASARTGGFNTVNIGEMSKPSLVVMMGLMIIGGAPGSTAGGIKIPTATLVLAAMLSVIKGHQNTLIFKRKISSTTVLRAFTVTGVFILWIFTGVMALSAYMPDEKFLNTIFEVVSAMGTVGLSTGKTMLLAIPEKLIITVCMFVGRVGAFTLMIFFLSRGKTSKLDYPEEKIILG